MSHLVAYCDWIIQQNTLEDKCDERLVPLSGKHDECVIDRIEAARRITTINDP
jgi:hypothetical protein